MRLVQRLAEHLDPDLANQTYVIFDSATGKRYGADTLQIHGIHVRFAVGHDEADDLIEELIAAHHSPKRLTVVSSDHRLQVAARRAGARAFDAQPWLDALLDGQLMLAIAWPRRSSRADAEGGEPGPAKPERLNSAEVEQWLRAFEIAAEEFQQLPEEIPRSEHRRSTRPPSSAASASPPPTRSTPPPPPPAATGQGRGRGRVGKRVSAPPASQPPPRATQPSRKRSKKSSPSKELPPDYNPFPPGYGEDLLGGQVTE